MTNPIDNKPRFRLELMKPAQDFLDALPMQVQDKIEHNITKVQCGHMDTRIFKKLENSNIWEFRTLYEGKAYRLFAFWDTRINTLVVATHGIMKKTQKTPAKEIAKAERLRQLYFEE